MTEGRPGVETSPDSETEDVSAPDAFASWRIPYVRPFVLGRMMAGMGSQVVSVAVGWELYERTGDPMALGLVGLVQIVPALALLIPAGSLADRLPRGRIAMCAHLLLGAAALGLAVASWRSGPLELTYALLFLSGAGRALAAPATNSLLAQLLRPKEFANAYAWTVSTFQLASVTGPALGGLLIALSGAAAPAFVLAAFGHFIFIGALTLLPNTRPSERRRSLGASDLLAGAAFIRHNPVYLSAITLDLFAVLLGGAMALLPVYARDILQIGPGGLGVLRAAPPLGAVVAALLATRLPPWRRPGRVLLIVVTGYGLATIGFGYSREVVLSLVCLVIIGALDSISMVIRGTLQQVITPDRLRGRVSSINSLFTGLSNELGAFESGALAAFVGPVTTVVVGGVGTLLVVGAVRLACPSLGRLGPLHTLRPAEGDSEQQEEGVPGRVRA